ncbi:MAG: hypothetical protein WCK31_05230 [bacterium]
MQDISESLSINFEIALKDARLNYEESKPSKMTLEKALENAGKVKELQKGDQIIKRKASGKITLKKGQEEVILTEGISTNIGEIIEPNIFENEVVGYLVKLTTGEKVSLPIKEIIPLTDSTYEKEGDRIKLGNGTINLIQSYIDRSSEHMKNSARSRVIAGILSFGASEIIAGTRLKNSIILAPESRKSALNILMNLKDITHDKVFGKPRKINLSDLVKNNLIICITNENGVITTNHIARYTTRENPIPVLQEGYFSISPYGEAIFTPTNKPFQAPSNLKGWTLDKYDYLKKQSDYEVSIKRVEDTLTNIIGEALRKNK